MNKQYLIDEIPLPVLNGSSSYRVADWRGGVTILVRRRRGSAYHYAQTTVNQHTITLYIGKAGQISITDVKSAVERLHIEASGYTLR